MSFLENIQSGKQSKPRRVVVYGVHGIGKSTFGASAPKPIFISIEDGLGDIDTDSFPIATSFADVLNQIGALIQEAHDYKTLVIDSLDWLERLIFAEVCAEKAVESIADIDYGKGYTRALNYWQQIIEGLELLRRDRGMMVIFLAHAAVTKFEPPDSDSYDRYTPKLHKHGSSLIQEWADEVLLASFKVITKSSDEGFNRKRTRGIGTGDRVLRTTEAASHLAKNRLGMAPEIPFSWEAFAEYL